MQVTTMPYLPLLVALVIGCVEAGCVSLGLDEKLFGCESSADCRTGHQCVVSAGEGICRPDDFVSDTPEPDQDTGESDLDALLTPDTDDVDASPMDTDVTTEDTTPDLDTAVATDTPTDLADAPTDAMDTIDAAPVDASDAADLPEVIVPETFHVTEQIRTSATWSAPHTYVLSEPIFVFDGATLTIEPGVTVLSSKDDTVPTAGALVVSRGGRLVAVGTASDPIVFTSVDQEGTRASGSWGGVQLLGRARVNTSSGDLYPHSAPEGELGDLDDYGGNDDDHDCGELRYVRIEFPGYAYGESASAGLGLASCGASTVIDHVQVHRAAGDGVFVAGGTVPLRYLLLTETLGSGIRYQTGWRGSAQFIEVAGQGSSTQGISGANFVSNVTATPASHPVFYNYTVVDNASHSLAFQDGGHGEFYNGLLLHGAPLVDVQAPSTVDHLLTGNLTIDYSGLYTLQTTAQVRNIDACLAWVDYDTCQTGCGGTPQDPTCLATCRSGTESSFSSYFSGWTTPDLDAFFSDTSPGPLPNCGAIAVADVEALLSDVSLNNVVGTDLSLAGSAPDELYPAVGTFADGGTPPPATDVHNISFDTTADYMGAIAPGGTNSWTSGWTAFPAN